MNLSKIHHIAIIVSDYEAAKDGSSEKPQKTGCYVQKCAVICAITEDVNLSWEGWQPSY